MVDSGDGSYGCAPGQRRQRAYRNARNAYGNKHGNEYIAKYSWVLQAARVIRMAIVMLLSMAMSISLSMSLSISLSMSLSIAGYYRQRA